jgi:hypothetical protein
MRALALGLGIAVAAATRGAAAQSPVPALDGAWRVVEVEVTGPGARTVESPQPGLLLFAGRHYSYTFVTSDGPRPPLPAGPATAEDLATAWNPFTANAGTFEVSGATMTRRPLVAKSPDAMAPGAYNQYSFRLSADTLWITTTATEAGPVRNPSTVRFHRVR